ncbi:DinB family protein [Planococcus sp. ISL-109]|uniref:DinB family protein n=1 Tax=Planococcus sp. ISL-109 TaxID=2819166 RepID=UPI001BEAD797|nr:DinB family protein [Planococcus sp. ISL-109]MBT2583849.1 DinB family protein [Planococcus sp. ISL-109]
MEQKKILQVFEEYEVYMESLLKTLSESSDAHKPIADGKWSIAQMVMHLAEWDRFIRSERLPHMKAGAHLDALSDVDAFNRQAIDKANTLGFPEIVGQAIQERRALKQQLSAVAPEQWSAVFYVGQKEMTMGQYFAGITQHDAHHFKQIDAFLT